MSYAQNDAFEGTHYCGSHSFSVTYCAAADLQSWNQNVPRGHADYRKVGWYWFSGRLYGPFSSSRKAYKAAMEALAKSEAA